jgi:hypothetical protein
MMETPSTPTRSVPGKKMPKPLPPHSLQSWDLERMDIPGYVKLNQDVLSFPAKVCHQTYSHVSIELQTHTEECPDFKS